MADEKPAPAPEPPVVEEVKKASVAVSGAHPAEVAWMSEILDHPWRIFYLNVIAGTGRGLGFALGFTILAGGVLTVGYRVAKSAVSLPLIGEHIGTFMVEVQEQMAEVRRANR